MSEFTSQRFERELMSWKIRGLMSTAALAYILGLRHALDADHISVRVSRC